MTYGLDDGVTESRFVHVELHHRSKIVVSSLVLDRSLRSWSDGASETENRPATVWIQPLRLCADAWIRNATQRHWKLNDGNLHVFLTRTNRSWPP